MWIFEYNMYRVTLRLTRCDFNTVFYVIINWEKYWKYNDFLLCQFDQSKKLSRWVVQSIIFVESILQWGHQNFTVGVLVSWACVTSCMAGTKQDESYWLVYGMMKMCSWNNIIFCLHIICLAFHFIIVNKYHHTVLMFMDNSIYI